MSVIICFTADIKVTQRRAIVLSADIAGSVRNTMQEIIVQMDREQIIQQYFQAWRKQDRKDFDTIFTKDLYYSECYGPEYHGLEEVKQWFDDWQMHGKVLQWKILHFYQDGNQSIAEWHFQCIYDQKEDEFNGVSIFQFTEKDQICSVKEFQSKAEHYDPYTK
jgi:ketosteroid isomerase-like protein